VIWYENPAATDEAIWRLVRSNRFFVARWCSRASQRHDTLRRCLDHGAPATITLPSRLTLYSRRTKTNGVNLAAPVLKSLLAKVDELAGSEDSVSAKREKRDSW